MHTNKQIIVSALVIGGAGVWKSWTSGKPIGRVLLGTYMLVVILSIIDLIGGVAATLAGGLAMIAAMGSIFYLMSQSQFLKLANAR
jgi:hypothetical protein